MQTKKLLGREYKVEPMLVEEFQNLDRWIDRDGHGKWVVKNGGVEGEWISNSPSLFLKEKIKGDFLWEITATRLQHDKALLERFQATKHGAGGQLLDEKYNFNFWIRADAPPGEEFFEAYPKYQGTGWNGMGDDHWHSYFNTVVWDPHQNWDRLRRSPGYEMVKDIHDAVPFHPIGEPHKFTFVVYEGHVRLVVDDKIEVYDFADPKPYQEGYIGLCVWICKVRFEGMRVYRIVK